MIFYEHDAGIGVGEMINISSYALSRAQEIHTSIDERAIALFESVSLIDRMTATLERISQRPQKMNRVVFDLMKKEHARVFPVMKRFLDRKLTERKDLVTSFEALNIAIIHTFLSARRETLRLNKIEVAPL